MADERPKVVRAFVRATEEKHSYISIVSVMGDEHLRESLLQSALDELRQFQRKYADLQELAEVFAVSAAVIKKVSA